MNRLSVQASYDPSLVSVVENPDSLADLDLGPQRIVAANTIRGW